MGVKRARTRGQALVEMALVAPILAYLMLGAADLGRAFYLNIEISGASRAGMRIGTINSGTDLGGVLRSEPDSAIPNTVATWADTGPGGANADCTSATPKCGDPTGCPPDIFTGTRAACFAVRTCTMTGGTCGAPYGAWQSRPTAGSNLGLDVLVVYKFTPVTPLMAQFVSPLGFFRLSSETFGLELY